MWCGDPGTTIVQRFDAALKGHRIPRLNDICLLPTKWDRGGELCGFRSSIVEPGRRKFCISTADRFPIHRPGLRPGKNRCYPSDQPRQYRISGTGHHVSTPHDLYSEHPHPLCITSPPHGTPFF